MLNDSPEAAEQLELQRLKQQLKELREEREAVDVSIEDDSGSELFLLLNAILPHCCSFGCRLERGAVSAFPFAAAGEVEGRVLRNHFNMLDKSNQTPGRATV